MKKIALIILAIGINVAASEQPMVLASSTQFVRRQATERERGEFYQAINLNDVAKVKALLALGISPKSRSMDQPLITFMAEAIDNERLEIIDLLLGAGEDVDGSNYGEAWIDMSLKWNKLNSFKHLISRGANVENIEKVSVLVCLASVYSTPEKCTMAKILLDLNQPKKGCYHWYYPHMQKFIPELKQEKRVMKTILMLQKTNVDNQLKCLPSLVIEELLRGIKGRHDYTGTSRTDLD